MKLTSIVNVCLLIVLLHEVSPANGELVRWRWRNDNGSVYTATWKDSVNTPVVLNGDEIIRLRMSLPLDKGDTSTISLRYSEEPANRQSWIPITCVDTGKFVISPSVYLSDTMSYVDNQLLPVDSNATGWSYRNTIALDSSTSHLLVAKEASLYELEFSLKPTSHIRPASAYFFSLFTDSEVLDYWGLPEFAGLLTPPVNWWGTPSCSKIVDLYDISFVDSNTGTAVGSGPGNAGAIFRTVNAGRTWVPQPSPTTDPLTSVDYADANVGIAVSPTGTILRTTDGGQSWQLLPNMGGVLYGITFADEKNGWIVGGAIGGGLIIRTTNGGETWISPPCPTFGAVFAVCFVSSDVGIAVGEAGIILRTTNGGQHWFYQWAGIRASFTDVCFTDANNGTIVGFSGGNGIILRTTDGGNTWGQSSVVGGSTLDGVDFVDKSTGWAVGADGWMSKTTDGGMSWQRVVSGSYRTLRAVHFVDGKIGWAVGDGGTILKSASSGVTSVDHRELGQEPTGFVLEQNYPNPLNPSTTIRYGLPHKSQVSLMVYNTLGQLVSQLVSAEQEAGYQEVKFDGLNLASGVYFYRLHAGDFVATNKLMVLR